MSGEARLEVGRLRLTFERCGDRYGHLVELVTVGQATPVLKSIEGSFIWSSPCVLMEKGATRRTSIVSNSLSGVNLRYLGRRAGKVEL